MRREDLYLADIVESADDIGRFLSGRDFSNFIGDEILRAAILQKLIVIGEAVGRLSTDFKKTHRGVEWVDIVAFRNFAIHAYFAVDWAIVWTAATKNVPVLKAYIKEITPES